MKAEVNVRDAEEPVVEWALLQLWPAPRAPDAVVRAGSLTGANWHQEIRKDPAG